MNSTVTFRDFLPTDRDPLLRLLAQGRYKGYLEAKASLFDWQFRGAPGSSDRSPFILGIVEQRIVAANGFMPVAVKVGERRVEAAWSCDTFVAPDMRGIGLGKQLIARVSARFPIVLGYGISDMSNPILEKFGWRLDPKLVAYFLPVSERGVKGIAKHALSKVQRALHGRTGDSSLVLATATAPAWEEYGALWAECRAGYTCAAERTAGYLAWKYAGHPQHRYWILTASQFGEVRGVLVMRHDPKVSVIVDYLGPAADVRVMSELLAAAADELSRRGTIRIKCETNHRPFQQAMEAVGFVASRYSSRFRVCNTAGLAEAGAEWLITSGDSDGDMLTPSG